MLTLNTCTKHKWKLFWWWNKMSLPRTSALDNNVVSLLKMILHIRDLSLSHLYNMKLKCNTTNRHFRDCLQHCGCRATSRVGVCARVQSFNEKGCHAVSQLYCGWARQDPFLEVDKTRWLRCGANTNQVSAMKTKRYQRVLIRCRNSAELLHPLQSKYCPWACIFILEEDSSQQRAFICKDLLLKQTKGTTAPSLLLLLISHIMMTLITPIKLNNNLTFFSSPYYSCFYDNTSLFG